MPARNKQLEIDPLGNGEIYAYDALDRLTSTTDRNGQKIASSYDQLNRKTGETWYNDSGSQINALVGKGVGSEKGSRLDRDS